MILAKGEVPFKTQGAAAAAAVNKKVQPRTYKIVPYEKGYAILMNGEDINKITAPTIEMSKPWDANDNKWIEDKFKTPEKKKGFRLCFCRKDELEGMLDQGYAVAKASEWGANSRQPDGSLIRDGMYGMELPEEMALERDASLSYQTQLKSTNNKDDIKVKINEIGKEAGAEKDTFSVSPDHTV